MSHGNVVTLTGKLRVVKLELAKRRGYEDLEAEATVKTGPESHGGVHRVHILSEEAKLTKAFIEANGGDGMFVTVSGTLYSMGDFARVHANWIIFHVPPYIEEKAHIIYRGVRSRK